MMVKTCVICEKMFETKTSRQLCCSPECSNEHHRRYCIKHAKIAIAKTKVCVICGEEFETTHSRKITCSEQCGRENHRRNSVENSKKWYARKKIERNNSVKKDTGSLADDVREARKIGVSYGIYKAMKQMKGDIL